MENKKMTKREIFAEMILALNGEVSKVSNEDLVAFCDHEVELLTKKHTSKKETELQKENKILSELVLNVLVGAGKGLTISEIQSLDERLKALSNQKVTSLIRKMIENGTVVKFADGKSSKFKSI